MGSRPAHHPEELKHDQTTCPSTGPESGVKMDFTVLVGEGLTRKEAAGNLDGLFMKIVETIQHQKDYVMYNKIWLLCGTWQGTLDMQDVAQVFLCILPQVVQRF